MQYCKCVAFVTVSRQSLLFSFPCSMIGMLFCLHTWSAVKAWPRSTFLIYQFNTKYCYSSWLRGPIKGNKTSNESWFVASPKAISLSTVVESIPSLVPMKANSTVILSWIVFQVVDPCPAESSQTSAFVQYVPCSLRNCRNLAWIPCNQTLTGTNQTLTVALSGDSITSQAKYLSLRAQAAGRPSVKRGVLNLSKFYLFFSKLWCVRNSAKFV